MRDKNRILPFCTELTELWSNYPDLRFGQIMSNLARYIRTEYGQDIFYMEDDQLMAAIRYHLRS